MAKQILSKMIFAGSLLLLAVPAFSLPAGLTTVENLETEKYLGKWYEVARLDFFFERGLVYTTAEYSLNRNGSIKVVNRGYNAEKEKWKEAKGKARFRSEKENGDLEVSFFGPFYSEYNIISIDGDYQYALVIGENTEYMWILSRDKTIPDDIKEKYLAIAKNAGVIIEDLIWVDQENP